jgi:hypothetical protein
MTGLTVPAAVTIGPNGLLYVTDSGTGEVISMSPSAVNATPGGPGTSVFASGIYSPGGLLYDRQNNSLFVSELSQTQTGFGAEHVYQFNAQGQLINTIGTGTGDTGRAGMTLDANQNLYVGTYDLATGNVLKFSASDNYATSTVFGSGALGASQMFWHNGTLSVATLFGDGAEPGGGVANFDSTGQLTSLNPQGLAYPSGLVARGASQMLVTEIGDGSTPGRVGIYNIDSGDVVNQMFITLAKVNAGIPDNLYFQPSSSFTYYLPGDFDLDGSRTATDIKIMLQALTNGSEFTSSVDLSIDEIQQLEDVNGDGQFNNADLQALLDDLKGSTPVEVPEPSSLLLASFGLAALGIRLRHRLSR